jgi:hypothetical protein
MLLVSDSQLYIKGTDYQAGIPFEIDEDEGQFLIARGTARKAEPPKVLYETKVIRPAEVGPVIPFRDVPMPDAQPETVAAAGNPMLSKSDLAEQGIADPGRRRGRKGRHSR